MTHDTALATLFQAPHEQFVAERKRLAGELRAAGDKAGAAALMKVNRPALSVWVVNQLWWKHRDAFLLLLSAANRVKAGELAATAQHRDALNALREKAVQVLTEAGHAAGEPTLRRVSTTLSALAASGGFAPDPEGCLREDRDPPGFEVMGAVPGGAVWSPAPAPSSPPPSKAQEGANPFLAMAKAVNGDADAKTVGTEVTPVVASVPTVSEEEEEEDLEAAAREAEAAAQKAAELAAAAKRRLEEANARKQREEVLSAARKEVERLRGELKAAEERLAALER